MFLRILKIAVVLALIAFCISPLVIWGSPPPRHDSRGNQGL